MQSLYSRSCRVRGILRLFRISRTSRVFPSGGRESVALEVVNLLNNKFTRWWECHARPYYSKGRITSGVHWVSGRLKEDVQKVYQCKASRTTRVIITGVQVSPCMSFYRLEVEISPATQIGNSTSYRLRPCTNCMVPTRSFDFLEFCE